MIRTYIRRAAFGAAVALVATGSLSPAESRAQEPTQNPHGEIAESCSSCHRSGSWTPVEVPSDYRHADGRFPLDGAHSRATCTSCHESLQFVGASPSCASCHADIHRGELGGECSRCHTTRSFVDRAAMTRAHQLTRFPLVGAHVMADCEGCHVPTGQGQLRFVAAPTSCESCHRGLLGSTSQPDHVAAGFIQLCESCHYPVDWNRARYDHAGTSFPLTGAHRSVTCDGCHGDNVYDGKPIDCVSCHLQDYNGATDPTHAGFTTTCTDCHAGTNTWIGATFDHDASAFPLTGAHRAVTCDGCHSDNVYDGKPTACVACHQQDYNGTTDPNHASAGFTTACTTCHNTTTWSGATFDHDATYFPIYSGKHNGRWSSCSTCHTSPSNYALFTCFSCHEHSQTQMDDTHKSEAGYRYDSPTCLSCHPRGDAP